MRAAARGAVEALAGAGVHPVLKAPTRVVEVGEVASQKEIGFDVFDGRFDLAFVLGRAHGVGVDDEAVVTSELAVAAIEREPVAVRAEGGAQYGRLEVVGDHGADHAAELCKSLLVQPQPRRGGLIRDQARHELARKAEHQDKDPGLVQDAGFGS